MWNFMESQGVVALPLRTIEQTANNNQQNNRPNNGTIDQTIEQWNKLQEQ